MLVDLFEQLFEVKDHPPVKANKEVFPFLEQKDIWILQASGLTLKPIEARSRRQGEGIQVVGVDVVNKDGLVLATFTGPPEQIKAFIRGHLNVVRHTLKATEVAFDF